jgi:pimeloyl-ACP methyl ester carboxylesterase
MHSKRSFDAKMVLAVAVAAVTAAELAYGALPPEVVTLVTKDGVQLRLTYFPNAKRPGSDEAKQVTPVVLLHDHKETGAIFDPLAQRLQAAGQGKPRAPSFAAITVDLRGHGNSAKQRLPNGTQIELDAARLNKQGLLAMVAYDMEAVRSYLVSKNDAGELNLNKLCIVGAGMGASVAANWALKDWTAPQLAVVKQGQDVKALALISPRWSYNGLSFQAPLGRGSPIRENVAWLLMYGAEDAKGKTDVLRIYKQLERAHPKPSAADKRPSTLQVIAWKDTKLQGSALIKHVGEPIEQRIVDFFVEHVGKAQQPWIGRLNRLPQ